MAVRIGFGFAGAIMALAVAGCTTQDIGTPSASTPSSATASMPSRPKDLSIANIDPCMLLTDSQMAQLTISRKAPGAGDPQGGATSGCSYQVASPIAYTLDVSLEPKRGVEDWLAGKWSVQYRQTMVSSYPAVQVIPYGANWNDPAGFFCSTYVSTAEGQEISAGVVPHDKDLSTTQMCDLSKQLAGLALATLQANQ